MDSQTLIAGGEQLTVEFKRKFDSDKDLVNAVVCMANGSGGTIFIGVDDDGTIVGTDGNHGQAWNPDKVAALIQSKTEPAIATRVSIEGLNDLNVVRIDVDMANPGPISTKTGTFIRRVLDAKGNPACIPMTPAEIVSMGFITRGQDYCQSPAMGATDVDLDPKEFDRFRALCKRANEPMANLSNEDILTALGLVPITAQLSLGAILLFGTEQAIKKWLPNVEVLFQDSRTGKEPTNERIIGPLLSTAARLSQLLDNRVQSVEVTVGLQRFSIPNIPEITRREAIANALVHRDYSQSGPIVVALTDTEFTVSSPGSFPPGVTIENILDQSRPRSVSLANALKVAGLIERMGKGVNEIYLEQLKLGRSAPDFSRSTSASVVLAISFDASDLELVQFLSKWEDQSQSQLSLAELRVINLAKSMKTVTQADISASSGMAPSMVRTTLGRLIEKGLVNATGGARNRRYLLSSNFYKRAGGQGAYVRIRNFEPLQQEQMILEYLATFETISRAQAAELCQVSPLEVRKPLKHLVEQGKIALVGEKRGSRYVKAEAIKQ